MKFRPLHALIVIEMDESPEFDGVIALPVFARHEVDTGTVVAAGKGEYDDNGEFTPNPVKAGDRVLVAKGSGIHIRLDEEDRLFVGPNEITGILK